MKTPTDALRAGATTLLTGASLLLILALLTAAVSSAAWTPELVGGSVAGGFESRPVEGSSADIDPSSGVGDGRYWFAPAEDWGGTFELWTRWKFRGPLGKSKLKLSYVRSDWVDGGIFARDEFGLDYSLALAREMEFEIEVEYLPEVYKRHRADKDAAPGEPQFRPETYESLQIQLALGKDWGPLTTSVLALMGRRDENQWFDERDRLGLGLGLGFDFSLWAESRIRPFYIRSSTESRNKPDLGSDLSFDEDTFGLRFLQDLGAFRAEVYGKLDLRSYTTSDPLDDSRFGRKDTGRYFSGKLTWRQAWLRPFVSFESSRHSSELPGVPAEDQDDGEDERTLIRTGFDFEWGL